MPDEPFIDPSAPLKNRRHENFALEMALGDYTSPADAYLKHFETDSKPNAKRMASHLQKRPEVAARIDYLRNDRVNRLMKQTVVSNAWVLEQLVKQYFLCDSEGDRKGAAQFLKMLAIEQGMLVQRREVIHGKMDQLEGSWEEIRGRLAARITRLFPGRSVDDVLGLLRAARAGRGFEGDRAAEVSAVRALSEAVDVSPNGGVQEGTLPDGGEPGREDLRRGNGDGLPHDRGVP